MVKKTLFKLEVFEDFTVNSFFAIPDDIEPRLATMEEEPLEINTISETCEYLMQLYRISLFPDTRKELLDNLKPRHLREEK